MMELSLSAHAGLQTASADFRQAICWSNWSRQIAPDQTPLARGRVVPGTIVHENRLPTGMRLVPQIGNGFVDQGTDLEQREDDRNLRAGIHLVHGCPSGNLPLSVRPCGEALRHAAERLPDGRMPGRAFPVLEFACCTADMLANRTIRCNGRITPRGYGIRRCGGG
jgi:hypothetical protein